jgi:hypothetical protein
MHLSSSSQGFSLGHFKHLNDHRFEVGFTLGGLTLEPACAL